MNELQLKAAIAEAVKTVGADAGKSSLAELIVKMVQPNHLSLDIFSGFMPVRRLNPGDNIQVKVRKGRYPVRTMVPGTMHLTDAVFRQDKTA